MRATRTNQPNLASLEMRAKGGGRLHQQSPPAAPTSGSEKSKRSSSSSSSSFQCRRRTTRNDTTRYRTGLISERDAGLKRYGFVVSCRGLLVRACVSLWALSRLPPTQLTHTEDCTHACCWHAHTCPPFPRPEDPLRSTPGTLGYVSILRQLTYFKYIPIVHALARRVPCRYPRTPDLSLFFRSFSARASRAATLCGRPSESRIRGMYLSPSSKLPRVCFISSKNAEDRKLQGGIERGG